MNNVLLLSGIVGSTAYGLATPDSDIDRLGIFTLPTAEFWKLRQPNETIHSTKPDVTLHEAAKWCRLALGCNPTVTELVWLPNELYETRTPLGDQLIEIRTAFLSKKRVRDAYLGYATQQFNDLARRGDGSFSTDTRKRTAKHARHLLRLCWQGRHLYRYGEVQIRLDDPDFFIKFGEKVASGDIDLARRAMAHYEEEFNMISSSLPEKPDVEKVERWLHNVRYNNL